jgi:hypothetical protein
MALKQLAIKDYARYYELHLKHDSTSKKREFILSAFRAAHSFERVMVQV